MKMEKMFYKILPQNAKALKTILVSFIILLLAIFILFNSRELVFGIKIKNVNLKNYMETSEKTLEVTGLAKNAVKLTLNGREIPIDQKGNFNETIILFPGYNVVEIKAEDKFGNHDEKNYKLMY